MQAAADTLATLGYLSRCRSALATTRVRFDAADATSPTDTASVPNAAALGEGCCCGALKVQKQPAGTWQPLVSSQTACCKRGVASLSLDPVWPSTAFSSPMVLQGSPADGPTAASMNGSNSMGLRGGATATPECKISRVAHGWHLPVAGGGGSISAGSPAPQAATWAPSAALEAAALSELARLVRLAPGGGSRGLAMLDQLERELGCARCEHWSPPL